MTLDKLIHKLNFPPKMFKKHSELIRWIVNDGIEGDCYCKICVDRDKYRNTYFHKLKFETIK